MGLPIKWPPEDLRCLSDSKGDSWWAFQVAPLTVPGGLDDAVRNAEMSRPKHQLKSTGCRYDVVRNVVHQSRSEV